MTAVLTPVLPAPAEPWKQIDPVARLQSLATHLLTPVLAALITALTPISGYSGFFVVWLPLHVTTAAALGRFGRRRKSFANSTLEVALGAAMVVFATFVFSVLSPVLVNGIRGFHFSMLTQDASATDVDAPLTTGGLLHALLGSTIIVGLATVVAVPIGILAALYVTEVRGKLTPMVRLVRPSGALSGRSCCPPPAAVSSRLPSSASPASPARPRR